MTFRFVYFVWSHLYLISESIIVLELELIKVSCHIGFISFSILRRIIGHDFLFIEYHKSIDSLKISKLNENI